MSATHDPGSDVAPPRGGDADPEPRLPSPAPAGFVTLHFLVDELRRRRLLVVATGLLGVALAVLAHVVLPAPVEVTTQVLLSHEPGVDPQRASMTDARLAESRTVARRAAERLGLDADELQQTYQVEAVTERVLEVSLSAATAAEAARRADALAAEFLGFRAEQVQARQTLVTDDLTRRIDALQEEAADLAGRIDALTADERSAGAPEVVAELEDQRASALSEVAALEQGVRDRRLATVTMNGGTGVLDAAAPVAASRTTQLAIDVVSALVAGLLLGGLFVVARALLSDRLRRRDDVAAALGAPVLLSVGPLRPRWWTRAVRRARRDRSPGVLVEQHLRHRMGARSSLALVALGDVAGPAQVLVTLATSLCRAGERVILVDLSGTGALARLLSVRGAGPHHVDVPPVVGAAGVGPAEIGSEGAGPLTLISSADELAPDDLVTSVGRGPAGREPLPPSLWAPGQKVLVLAVVDPALGADHLAGWASTAVALVTAGAASATTVHSVGELVRLAGVDLDSAVLASADPRDTSLGTFRVRAGRGSARPDPWPTDLGSVIR